MGAIFEMMKEDIKKDINTELARKLLIRGMSVAAIAEDTGLSVDVINQLQSEINNE